MGIGSHNFAANRKRTGGMAKSMARDGIENFYCHSTLGIYLFLNPARRQVSEPRELSNQRRGIFDELFCDQRDTDRLHI